MGDKGVPSPSSSDPSPDDDRDQDQDASSPDATDPTTQIRSSAAGDGQSKPTVPMQKRRRVTRACDECRRKKIKCDGKQPCTHCTVYSYGKSFTATESATMRLQTNRAQSVLTTSHQTGGGILLRNTLKH